ncbi:N-acetyltransferase [Calothrix sp. PCC 7507]|uniref:N-acetyltransferase n=1 Tax=Calothrix sp. PCC 7507 TaxID=99598 RepID=UPI00029F3726|nr:N-acetyltransferase [Calothrix sp. PCC 7507]AFY34344.1 hypothetical protein Cal7507_3957 [Calothrix sp. PCC 7507]
MAEARLRKQPNSNYGKSKVIAVTDGLNSLCYMTPSNLTDITTTVKEWQKQIKANPKLFSTNYTKFLSSKFAQVNITSLKTFTLNSYVDGILNSYEEFENSISEADDLSDLRFLRGDDATIYSLATVRRSKRLLNSSCATLNEPMPWLDFFLVNPIFLNQGIGKLTIQYIIADIGHRIASQIYVDSAGFFEKQGFKLVIYNKHYDADFYIAENLTSPLIVYNISVSIPDGEYCNRVIDVACSSNQGIEYALSKVKQVYPNSSGVYWEDIESNKIYSVGADGSVVEYDSNST